MSDVPDVWGSALLSRRILPSRANATRRRKMNCINRLDFSNPDLKSVISLAFRVLQESQTTFCLDSLHRACSCTSRRRQILHRRHLACQHRCGKSGGASLTHESSIVVWHSTQVSEVGVTLWSGWGGSGPGRFPSVSRKMFSAVESLKSCSCTLNMLREKNTSRSDAVKASRMRILR